MDKDMSRALVSVIMPVYNAEGFLAEAIESILGQTFEDIELIIINDGSSDKSLKIIERFAQKDKRIIFKSRANKGLIATLNEAVLLAKGQYIARQDADDISHPTRLEKQLSFLDNHPDIGLLGTNIEVIDDKGEVVPRSIAFVDFLAQPNDLKLAEVFSNQFAHGSIIVRSSYLKQAKYDKSYRHAEDYELWTRISHKTHVANLKEPLYIWRLHEKGITRAHSSEMTDQAFKIANREFDYYLTHEKEFKLFSFNPLSMRGGLLAYLRRKSALYRDMALMYCHRGLRRRALPVLALAVLHSPWSAKNYRFLIRVLTSRDKVLQLEYELF